MAYDKKRSYERLHEEDRGSGRCCTPAVFCFSRIFVENGTPDYFLIWLACGVPFGIGKMFTLIPIGFGISGTVGVVALNLVLGGLIGGVILIWKLAVAIWYLPLSVVRFMKA